MALSGNQGYDFNIQMNRENEADDIKEAARQKLHGLLLGKPFSQPSHRKLKKRLEIS
jgi:hypothetical protein